MLLHFDIIFLRSLSFDSTQPCQNDMIIFLLNCIKTNRLLFSILLSKLYDSISQLYRKKYHLFSQSYQNYKLYSYITQLYQNECVLITSSMAVFVLHFVHSLRYFFIFKCQFNLRKVQSFIHLIVRHYSAFAFTILIIYMVLLFCTSKEKY